MKLLPLLIALFTFAACADAQVKAQQEGPVIGEVDHKEKLRQGPAKPGKEYLTLRIGSAAVEKGEKVCLPIEATGFKDLIGFQYTIRFDSAALDFDRVRSFNLPGYQANSFGTRFADRGVVSSLWTDLALKGTSLADNHRLYEICFTNLMEEGETTTVEFSDGPTSFEVIDKAMAELRFIYANGKVTSK
ncbi:cohesin domain-containing protein [Lewinella sp. 4G2]|uniref:cohesin domain-containing protein n=1 Tax=Lewinella sp. 4G2 TaxID=1803372 RepID=UPI0007B4DE9A|nr:cohesin domain-containing protein [Lewinella sp. 4G2]OAV44739.1 hypothetical protein A3850_009660 [Lewinella sp. 4G2]